MASLKYGQNTTGKNDVNLKGILGQNYSLQTNVTVRNTTTDKYEHQVMTDTTDVDIDVGKGNYSVKNNSGTMSISIRSLSGPPAGPLRRRARALLPLLLLLVLLPAAPRVFADSSNCVQMFQHENYGGARWSWYCGDPVPSFGS